MGLRHIFEELRLNETGSNLREYRADPWVVVRC
jgi:hypothetical protein